MKKITLYCVLFMLAFTTCTACVAGSSDAPSSSLSEDSLSSKEDYTANSQNAVLSSSPSISKQNRYRVLIALRASWNLRKAPPVPLAKQSCHRILPARRAIRSHIAAPLLSSPLLNLRYPMIPLILSPPDVIMY